MKSFNLVSKKGEKYSVTLPEPTPGFESAYVFAFAKSGSTLLDNILTAYSKSIGVSTFSLFGQAFDQGINTRDIDLDAQCCFLDSGYLYVGFRHFPGFDIDLTSKKSILLTRDPRDMLVSLYYSIAKSHVIPKNNKNLQIQREKVSKQGIDDYVIQAASTYNRQLKEYQRALSESNLSVYRYEDVIYHKLEWIQNILDYLGIKENQRLLKNIVSKFDVIPDTESPDKHIRQVHPGNYKKKLQPQTIKKLNNILSPFLEYFDYEIEDKK
ncbi:MAG: sulfotransferase domain-containing protein [Methylohalobius sp. ZOD2]